MIPQHSISYIFIKHEHGVKSDPELLKDFEPFCQASCQGQGCWLALDPYTPG